MDFQDILKALATPVDVMNNIAVRKNRNVILKSTEKKVDEICSEIGLNPSAIKKWLEFLSVPQTIDFPCTESAKTDNITILWRIRSDRTNIGSP